MNTPKYQYGYYCFCIGLFLCILYSMLVWFASEGNLFYNNVAYLFLALSLLERKLWKVQKHSSMAVVYIVIWLLTRDFDMDLAKLKELIPIVLLFYLDASYHKRIIVTLTKMFAVCLIPSIALHILIMYIPIPPFAGFFDSPITMYGRYLNYIFYIHNLGGYSDRFNAFVHEPGHLGMIMSFFLFANKYQIKKWYVLVCLIALLFSLSLSGYVLAVVGFFIYSLMKNSVKTVFKYSLSGILIVFMTYYFAVNYNGGHNYLNEKIVQRLKYDEEKGIEGNNRFTEYTDTYFSNKDFSSLLIGLREQHALVRKDIDGAGYKIFIIEYGFISLFLTAFLYVLIARKSTKENRNFCYGMIALYSLAFLQRAYPYWASWLIPYICICLSNLNLHYANNANHQRNQKRLQ